MSIEIYIDGKYYPKEEARVSVYDHGLLYGDGVFEGIQGLQRKGLSIWKSILERLYLSARSILIDIPLSLDEMREAVLETLRRNEFKDAYIRLLVTRGSRRPGSWTLVSVPSRRSSSSPIPLSSILKRPTRTGLKLIVACDPKEQPRRSSVRGSSRLNYLNNILGKIEAINAGVAEAVMLDRHGYVTECTSENIFVMKGDKLITPGGGGWASSRASLVAWSWNWARSSATTSRWLS